MNSPMTGFRARFASSLRFISARLLDSPFDFVTISSINAGKDRITSRPFFSSSGLEYLNATGIFQFFHRLWASDITDQCLECGYGFWF